MLVILISSQKKNQRVITIVPQMEIINKSSTNQKTHVCELPSTKTTNISTILRKKEELPC